MPAAETGSRPTAAVGRLKVFLGYASGVGKSHRMFDEARRRQERGQDIVVAALQPVVPEILQPLLSGLEIIPMLTVEGIQVVNLPAVLDRHPRVCIVDGLAYDNPPCWHNAHRWQDVQQFLAAGIDVIASLNLQFIEDQREAVERLTGKHVKETVPRSFLTTADDIVVVDTPADARSGTSAALREMALLLVADVLDQGLQGYLHANGLEAKGRTHERLLYITPGADADRMITVARRSAEKFHCDVLVAWVDDARLSTPDRRLLDNELERVAAAGLRVEKLTGEDASAAVAQYAAAHGVTQIFAGHSRRGGLLTRLFGSPVSELIRAARGMDVRVFPN